MRSTVPGVPPMPALDVEREMAAHAADPMRRRQRWAARRPWLIVAGALSVLVVVFGGLGAFTAAMGQRSNRSQTMG
ncbi:hypothetical protein [Williamsia sp. CHRR-6]|uniref:hypothetical protein n=1 Tax=Williamsia sp. CHRR-6 TaxID=2835871 RepID=UPI001BDA93AF|nr:hypothetical protein [Williamsia sp. CHRR-6]MBT0566441.1 hypothetical protein [Williamsia sp. CHRR-6]